MTSPKKPSMKRLIGRTIASVEQVLREFDDGEQEWDVARITLDDGSCIEFLISDCEDGDDAVVQLLHTEGGAA